MSEISIRNQGLPSYLAAAAQELDEQAKLVTSFNLRYPSIKMEKDRPGFVVSLDDQVSETPNTITFLVLGPKNVYGSRALFPVDDDADAPLCSTRLANPSNEWVGRCNDNETAPGAGVRCVECPYSRFGSASEWDPQRGGNGQACKERRNLFGVKMREAANHSKDNPMYELDGETVYRLVLPATSIKATESMIAKCMSASLPLSGAVFRLSNIVESRGSIKWTKLRTELIGVVANEESYNRIKDIGGNVNRVVCSNGELETESYKNTTHAEDDIPF